MLFGLHDSMMTAWRAAADDRQGAFLRGHRELDGKVADKGELGGKPDLTDASRAGMRRPGACSFVGSDVRPVRSAR